VSHWSTEHFLPPKFRHHPECNLWQSMFARIFHEL
jgi:hypothetical protein